MRDRGITGNMFNKEVNKNITDVGKERRDALEFIELYSIFFKTRVDDTKLKLSNCFIKKLHGQKHLHTFFRLLSIYCGRES